MRNASAWLLAIIALTACQRRDVELGSFDYASKAMAQHCQPGMRSGPAGASDDGRTAHGVGFGVRTPRNYDATMAHPLLVVFAPAGGSHFASESLTGLTTAATAAGFVVAYADSVSMSVPGVQELGSIPGLVAKRWCIDESRVFYSGHSDGGTVSVALAVLPQRPLQPAGIAPSAAGFTSLDLAAFACPAPLPVMVMHSAEDTHFNGYGRQIVHWWAQCNKCDLTHAPATLPNGCVAFDGCAAPVQFCEGRGGHERWPDRNAAMLQLFGANEGKQVQALEATR